MEPIDVEFPDDAPFLIVVSYFPETAPDDVFDGDSYYHFG